MLVLLGVAVVFSSNHLAARFAFDHGVSVAAAVAVRAASTSLVMLVAMRLMSIAVAIPRALRAPALFAGILVATQSYCLYSAVKIISPALALLVFHTSPMLYVLLTWALRNERPRWGVLAPMLLALVGLALALDLRTDQFAARWHEIGTGAAWAFASAVCMTLVYYLNAHSLKAVDGRLRTFTMTTVTAVLMLAGGVAADALVMPHDTTGWVALVCLTVLYCVGMISLFVVLPRISVVSTAALNFEPISLLALGWLFLGQSVTPLQLAGAFVTVSAIAWLGLSKH